MSEWQKDNPPKDREFLAFAVALGIPEITKPIRVVAAWEKFVEEWRPTKVPGDRTTGTKLKILAWTELPEEPAIE
jgi:hypothetical protein